MPGETTDQPFAEALRSLLASEDVGLREFARRTEGIEGGFKPTYASYLHTGRVLPTVQNIEVTATVLGRDASYFLEYRQHLAAERARKLVASHGLTAVLTALDKVGATKRAGGVPAPVPPGELGRRAAGSPASTGSRGQSPRRAARGTDPSSR